MKSLTSRIRTIVLITIAVLITITASQNLTDTKIQLLLWDLQAPLILVILISLTIGFVVGYLLKGIKKTRSLKEEKKHEKTKSLVPEKIKNKNKS